MTKLWRKLIGGFGALMLSMTLFASLGPSTAGAITPAQTTGSGTAQTLYSDVNNFWATSFRGWGWSAYYKVPSLHFYNTTVTACGVTWSPNNSFACSTNIWIGTSFTQRLLNSYGDYGAGVILAHEWGHEIMFDVGWRGRTVLGQELFADCLAGMYTRWGITVSHKLNTADYAEGWYALRSIANNGDHGTAQNRSDWYAYGYSQYNINSCYQALYY